MTPYIHRPNDRELLELFNRLSCATHYERRIAFEDAFTQAHWLEDQARRRLLTPEEDAEWQFHIDVMEFIQLHPDNPTEVTVEDLRE